MVFAAAAWLVATAHVGSPDVTFDGAAGPYTIRVDRASAERRARSRRGDRARVERRRRQRRASARVLANGSRRLAVARQDVARGGTAARVHRPAVAHGARIVQRLRARGRPQGNGNRDRPGRLVRHGPTRSLAAARRGCWPRSPDCWSPASSRSCALSSGESLVPPGEELDAGPAQTCATSSRRSRCRFSRSRSSAARAGGTRSTPTISARCFTRRSPTAVITGDSTPSHDEARAQRHGGISIHLRARRARPRQDDAPLPRGRGRTWTCSRTCTRSSATRSCSSARCRGFRRDRTVSSPTSCSTTD